MTVVCQFFDINISSKGQECERNCLKNAFWALTRWGGARGPLSWKSWWCWLQRLEGGGVITCEKMFLNDCVQLCHIDAYYGNMCIYCQCQNNSSTELHVALFTTQMERAGGRKKAGLWTQDGTDLLTNWFLQFSEYSTTPTHSAPPLLGLTEAAVSYRDLREEDAAPAWTV